MLHSKQKLYYIPLIGMFVVPLMVLVGWTINNPYLTRVFPQFTPMNPVTALCLLALAFFLATITFKTSDLSARIVSITTAILLIGVGGLISLKFLFGIDLHIDRIFFEPTLGINHMAPATAANLFFFGIAIVLRKYSPWVSRFLLLVVVFVGLYAMAAYIYNFVGVYGNTVYNPMAIHTAFLFVLSGLYVLIQEGRGGVFCSSRWSFLTNWFENLRITQKFIVGFGIVIGVILFFSLYAVSAVNRISAIYLDQEKSTLAGQTALKLEVDTLQIRATFERFLKTGDQSYIAQIAAGRATTAAERQQLRELSTLPKTIQLLNDYEAKLPARVALTDKIIALVMSGAKPESYASLVVQRDVLIDNSNITLNDILQTQEVSLSTLIERAQNQTRVIEVNFIFLSMLVLVLIFFLSLIIARSIIRPVKMLKEQADRLATGDFTARTNIHTHDDLGKLTDTMNAMASALGSSTVALQHAKAQDEAILSSIGDAVFAIDAKKKLILINPIAEAMAGIHKEDAIGKLYNKSLRFEHEENGTENGTFIKKALSGTKTSMENHTVLVSTNGKKIPVADSASPLIDDEGKVVGAVVVFRDVTHEREIDQAKNEFVSLASHQLRTPLTSIKWYSELLLDEDEGKLTKAQKEYAQEIEAAMVRMNDLVASLLDVSRLDLGTFIIEPAPSDLIAILQDTSHEQLPSFTQKKQEFVFKHPEKMPPFSVDPKLLRIIIQNLLSNAHKYTPEKGVITLSIEQQKNGECLISCVDTGYGIPVAQQNSVFKKLFRADNIRTLDVEGTGLGLYIIKTIVDAAGCTIAYTSFEGKGTTFTISIPKTGMRAKGGLKTLSGEAAV